jgi:hypothetical protein
VSRGGGVFICVKNNIVCGELWVDEDFEIRAVELKGRDPKFTWEILGIYRAPKDMRVRKIGSPNRLYGKFYET